MGWHLSLLQSLCWVMLFGVASWSDQDLQMTSQRIREGGGACPNQAQGMTWLGILPMVSVTTHQCCEYSKSQVSATVASCLSYW